MVNWLLGICIILLAILAMFTKLQCCQKERDSQQEGDGGDSREMEGYRVKTNSIAN